MLRVRPLVSTPDLPAAARFLHALGLTPAADPAPDGSYAVFDAGSGRVALHACAPGSPAVGTTALTFDVADVREFARRTAEAGTPTELTGEADGLSARITGPDATALLAGPGPRGTGAPSSPLTVIARWSTPDVAPAVRILNDIGARARTHSDDGTWQDFSAKNGGVVAVRACAHTAVDLAFEYDGDVRDVAEDLAAGGFDPVVVDGGDGRSLRVPTPWGTRVWITERQRDIIGSAVH